MVKVCFTVYGGRYEVTKEILASHGFVCYISVHEGRLQQLSVQLPKSPSFASTEDAVIEVGVVFKKLIDKPLPRTLILHPVEEDAVPVQS